MEKFFEINSSRQNIRCKLYFNKKADIEKVVLFGHGFAGHKDNSAAQKFADRILTKNKGIAVLVFNLPCHGDDVKKKLVLQDCITYCYRLHKNRAAHRRNLLIRNKLWRIPRSEIHR